MSEISHDLTFLMPDLSVNYGRFSVRYADLSAKLTALSIEHCFAENHTSYDPDRGAFRGVFDVTRTHFADLATAPVVRDLTMTSDAKPLYSATGVRLVHHPDTNRFLANKANLLHAAPEIHPASMVVTEATLADGLDVVPGERVVIKPVQGMVSKGVRVVSKRDALHTPLGAGSFVVSEFIDTSGGVQELGIQGVHNLRTISIGGTAIGAIARVGGSGGEILRDDIYGAYVGTDELPESMHRIVDVVHSVLQGQPGEGKNVIAIDLMRGRRADGEVVDVLCEVNRRPVRISAYDLGFPESGNHASIRTIAQQWDSAEAAMLADIVRA